MDRLSYRYSGRNAVTPATARHRHSSNRANLDPLEMDVRRSSSRRSIGASERDSFSFRGNRKDLDGKNDLDIQVGCVDDTTVLSVGDIVGYELVSSDGKWMWTIGTILTFGSDSGAVSGGVDLSLMSLQCWTLKPDVTERRTSRSLGSSLVESERQSLQALRRRRDEIAREKLTLERVRQVEGFDRRQRAADAARESLLRLDDHHWEELLALQRPMAAVRAVVRAVFALLRIELLAETEEEEWASQRRFMATDAFRRLLAEPAATRVSSPMTPVPHIGTNVNIDANAGMPAAVELMLRWVDGEMRLRESKTALEHANARLRELQQAEEEAKLELRWRERGARNRGGDDGLHYNGYDDLRGNNDKDDDDDSEHKNGKDEGDEENVEEDVHSIVKSFSEHGRALFVKGNSTTIVIRSSVFCKVVAHGVKPTLRSFAINHERLSRIRAAAREKHRCLANIPSSVKEEGEKQTQEQSRKLLDTACQVEVMYEQSFKRERLIVHELELLYEKHIQYTNAQLRLLRRSLAAKAADAASTNARNTANVMELAVVHNRVKELEETLREKEESLRTVQAAHDEAIRQAQGHMRREAGRELVYEQTRHSVLAFQRFRLEHEEEVTRLRISSDEASKWSLLLMHELGGSKDLAIAEMSQRYLQEVGILRRKLVERERRQLKTVSVLEDSLINTHAERQKQQGREPLLDSEERQNREFATMLAVERALNILRATDSPETSVKTFPTTQSEKSAQSTRTGKQCSPTQNRGLENSKLSRRSSYTQERSDSVDVVVLKDRLVAAMQERELIEDILARERERNRLLTDQGEALRSELLQEVERHAALEGMVKTLQEEVSTMMGSLRSSSYDNVRDLHDGDGVNQRDWESAQRKTIAELRAIITMYDRHLSELLAAEGLTTTSDFLDYYDGETNVGALVDTSFSSLRGHLAQLKDTCAAMQAQRDAQAADANMLESYLKTAADALENALVHDERWKPRTTKSKHTTWHCKTFPGNDWEIIIAETPEALSKALMHDIVAACHLPDDYVLNLRYYNEGSMLRVSFDLRHDPSISADEISRRLSECNFYELEKLYARRFTPEEGIDALRRKLREKDAEMRRLRETIVRLRNGSIVSWSTGSGSSSLYA